MQRLIWLVILASATACQATGTPGSGTGDPPSSPTPGSGAVIVTLQVAGSETYRLLLSDPADIAQAEAWQAGSTGPLIPNGRIVRDGDGGVNTGYSWHIDPNDVELVDLAIEVCDGLPSHVEDGTLSGDRYCPWSSEVVSIDPAGS